MYVWDSVRGNVKTGSAGTGNTALVYRDRRLTALQEAAGPFVFGLRADGTMASVGYHTHCGGPR